jgi:NADH-quinone oxidoreductase subunit C
MGHSEIFGTRIFWNQNFLEPEFFGARIFWSQNFLEPEFFGARIFWSQKFGSVRQTEFLNLEHRSFGATTICQGSGMSSASKASKGTLTGSAAVLQGMAGHPAIKAILAWKPEALVDAKFDRGELTLTIAPEEIRATAATVQAAGYNFFEDMTAVDWFPSSPRFQLSYQILSHSYKESIRLSVLVDGTSPAVESITPIWPGANFYEREVFDLFGVRFEGHPNLRRILMPDDWQGYPMRKDYPVEGYR